MRAANATDLQINRQLKVFVIDEVEVFEQYRLHRGLHHRVGIGVHGPKGSGHRAKFMRQRLDKSRQRGPINVESRQLVADKKSTAIVALLFQAGAKRRHTCWPLGPARPRPLPEYSPYLFPRCVAKARADSSASESVRTVWSSIQAFGPAIAMLAAQFVTITEHQHPVLDIVRYQGRSRLKALGQKELFYPG